jgi:hypothetical protein
MPHGVTSGPHDRSVFDQSAALVRPDGRTIAFRIAVVLLIALLVFEAGRLGLRFRRWVWDTTTPIRFSGDLDRGFEWGRVAADEGLLNQYEKMQYQRPAGRKGGHYWIHVNHCGDREI